MDYNIVLASVQHLHLLQVLTSLNNVDTYVDYLTSFTYELIS
jgi:hypothetical protein